MYVCFGNDELIIRNVENWKFWNFSRARPDNQKNRLNTARSLENTILLTISVLVASRPIFNRLSMYELLQYVSGSFKEAILHSAPESGASPLRVSSFLYYRDVPEGNLIRDFKNVWGLGPQRIHTFL